MHSPLRDHLEAYLSGILGPAARRELETHLVGCAACRGELAALEGSARDLRLLQPPPEFEAEAAPGFFLRVLDRIEQERSLPFWTLLVDPHFGRRLVFACLMLLALLGGWVAAVDPVETRHFPEAILAGQPAAGPLPNQRLGPDLQRNRSAVLVTLAADTD